MNADSASPTSTDRYFRQLVDRAGVAWLAVDRELTVQYCNPHAAALLDRAGEQLQGMHISRLLEEQPAEVVERLLKQTLETGQCRDIELHHFDSRGTARHLALTVSPVGEESGTPPGASVCIRDITRRIELQEQLGQARKMRALGKLAGKIAHYFNNILGGVVTRVDFAKGSGEPRLMKKTLDGTAESLQRATRLLDGLLAFAEADHRDGDLADLTETVLHFVQGIEPELVRRQVELDLRISRIPVVAVSLNHFNTVLTNITNNALDAMSEGGKMVIELEADEHQAICRITDSGKGIVREELPHVFEPFYSTKDDRPGERGEHHGLGLSVAMGIVHEMRGEITIASQPHSATVVEIRLPLDPDRPVASRWADLEQKLLCPEFEPQEPLGSDH